MKTAICYYSRHHGNTKKVLEAMAGDAADLIDVTASGAPELEDYDRIGFASGIYFGKFHETLLRFMEQRLPDGKEVFFVYTCGSKRKGYTKAASQALAGKNARFLGEYGCRGYDTFGPFQLIGGIAKGHPNTKELDQAKAFFAALGGGT